MYIHQEHSLFVDYFQLHTLHAHVHSSCMYISGVRLGLLDIHMCGSVSVIDF